MSIRKERAKNRQVLRKSVFLFKNCQFYDIVLKEENKELVYLEKLSAFEASNYLFNLFKNHKVEYACTPVKMQKLVLILEVLLVKRSDGNQYFHDIDEIVIAPCGCKVPKIAMYIPSEITDGEITNEPLHLTEEDREYLLNCNDMHNPVFNQNYISAETREIIIDLFDSFGGYSAKTLGDFFNPLRPDNCEKDNDVIVSIEEFNKWILDYFDKLNNPISNFVREHING